MKRGAVYINATVSAEAIIYKARALSVFSTKRDAEKWLERQVAFEPYKEFTYRAVEEEFCEHTRRWSEAEN